MAAVCDICAKKPNIQRVRATVNGAPKRLNVCTGCLKAGKVTR